MYCPSSLFSSIIQSPTMFQPQKYEQPKQSKNTNRVEDMSNLNLSICVQSLIIQYFLKRENIIIKS